MMIRRSLKFQFVLGKTYSTLMCHNSGSVQKSVPSFRIGKNLRFFFKLLKFVKCEFSNYAFKFKMQQNPVEEFTTPLLESLLRELVKPTPIRVIIYRTLLNTWRWKLLQRK